MQVGGKNTAAILTWWNLATRQILHGIILFLNIFNVFQWSFLTNSWKKIKSRTQVSKSKMTSLEKYNPRVFKIIASIELTIIVFQQKTQKKTLTKKLEQWMHGTVNSHGAFWVRSNLLLLSFVGDPNVSIHHIQESCVCNIRADNTFSLEPSQE